MKAEAELRPLGVSAPREPDLGDHYLPCLSPQMQALAATVARIAATDAPVLICGEPGTGKATLARQIYSDSPRRSDPLVVLHAATTTRAAVEELGRLAAATVLCTQVSELAPAVQDSLVRLMVDMPPRPHLRFISTSSRDLTGLTARQGMRADLLYRLDVVRLTIPPLRQRSEDIIFLAEHFLAVAARRFRRDVRAVGPDARACLEQRRWPGNVRELSNCVMESVLYCAHVSLRAADLRLRTTPAAMDFEAELATVWARLHAAQPEKFYARTQQLLLQWALNSSSGNQLRAAALLGIGRGSLRSKLRRYQLTDG